MDPVRRTPEPNQDLGKLAEGVDRVEVALAALKESNLSAAQVQQLEDLLKKLKDLLKKVVPAEGAASVTTSPAVSKIKFVDGHQAVVGIIPVVGEITVNGQRLDTLLSGGSFNTLSQQHTDASKLGYWMATREEHCAYVKDLFAKEDNNTINDAEKCALRTYGLRFVRDAEGGLLVVGRDVVGYSFNFDEFNDNWTLFVRTSAESK